MKKMQTLVQEKRSPPTMNVAAEVERILATGDMVVDVTFIKALNVSEFGEYVAALAKQGVTVVARESQWNAVAANDTAVLCSSFTVVRDPVLNQREDASAEEDVASQDAVRDCVKELRAKPAYGTRTRYFAYKSRESIRETATKIGVLPEDEFVRWAVKPYGACAVLFL